MSAVWFVIERLTECSMISLYIFFLYRNLKPIGSRSRQVALALGYGFATFAFFASGIGLRPYGTLLLLIVYASSAFEGLHRVHILWCVYAIITDGIVDHSVVSAFVLLTGVDYAATGEPGWIRLIYVAISRLFLLATFLAMTLRAQRIDRLPWRTFALLIGAPTGCWVLLVVLFRYNDMPVLSQADVWLPFAGGFALLIIAIANAMSFYRILAQQRELATVSIQLRVASMTQRHVEQMNDLYDQMACLRHDLKHHFEAIAGLCRAGEHESIASYVQSFLEDDAPIVQRYVEHPVLDALIASKDALARRAGVTFTYEMVLPHVMPVSDVDLCILMGNLLENAFEATEELPDDIPRYVRLNAQLKRNCWTIICRNSVRSRRSDCAHGCLPSTKKSPGFHGIGTRQIRDIAEGTGGGVIYSHEQYQFAAIVMLKMPGDTWEEGVDYYGSLGEMEHELLASLPCD